MDTIYLSGQRKACGFFLLTLLLTTFFFSTSFGQSLPSGFSQVQVASGINNPTVMAFAPDGRIFVAEQSGKLRVIKNGSLLSTPFISLSVNSSGERGLLGIAFDPNFSSNQYIYLFYTRSSGSNNRVSRFKAQGDVVQSGSETVILELDPLSSATNHNGGTLRFGNDGKLYIATGENANTSNSQNLDTYHGKILRVNPDGSVPSGNPYTSGSSQKRRVWSYGVRNPFTFDIQKSTGKIFINDVGSGGYEEINNATSSNRNFGWPGAEGNSSNGSYTNPVFYYESTSASGDNKGCAITGGTFLNGSTNYPSQYQGKYFYMDFCNRWINYIDPNSGSRSAFATNIAASGVGITAGNDGSLYYLSRSNDAVYKIVYNSGSAPQITSQPQSRTVAPGQSATFSVSASGSTPLSYQWQKNSSNISGATSSNYTISNVSSSHAGQYRCMVSNSAGSVTSSQATLSVTTSNTAPVAQINTPSNGLNYQAGDVISFSGSATDSEDGSLPSSAFSWTVDFYHDTHKHDGPPVAQGTKNGSFQIPVTGETESNVWYRILLTVTDSDGATNTTFVQIYPRKTSLDFQSSPSGLTLTLDGQPITTQKTVTSVEGLQRAIGVVSPQTLNGTQYEFDYWQQGGSATQTITTPVDRTIYKAIFKEVSGGGGLRPADNPSNTVNGIDFEYYHGSWANLPNFNSLNSVTDGAMSNFSLSPAQKSGSFGFLFTGYINVPTDGTYTFYTESDDGSALFIGSQLVVDNDGLHGMQERSGSIGLAKGKHAIRVEYFESGGGEGLKVRYSGPGISKQSIPANVLYRSSSTASGPATLEAEDAYLSGVKFGNTHSGYTGSGYGDYGASSGEYIEWTYNAPAAGTYTVSFRYALGSSTRYLRIKANGSTKSSSKPFPGTGSWGNYQNVGLSFYLNQGTNKIRVESIGSSGPNMDHVRIEQGSNASARNGATSEAEAQRDLPLGTLSIKAYPNPASETLYLNPRMSSDSDIVLKFSDIMGHQVDVPFERLRNDLISVDVSAMKVGLYLIRLEQDNMIYNQRVLISK